MKFSWIFQTDSKVFYRWFEEAAANNIKAARLLLKLCKNPKLAGTITEDIHKLEHKGDNISHSIYDELRKIFVPPLDREDIISLTRSLDDVIDLIYTSASRIDVYNIKKVDKIINEFAQIIYESTVLTEKAFSLFRSRKGFSRVNSICIEINKKENEADILLKEGLRKLFKNGGSSKKIIATKDIYETLELATDALEDIAHELSGLTTKYG
ncbi:MAG: DUF47 family protein [Candidatus Levybacteria bacterium]|nr:DUF47 family protein [Candidatus Levybacteria bacterium]